MQPRNPELDTYRKLVHQLVENINPLIATGYDSPLPTGVWTLWRPVPGLFQQIDQALNTCGEYIFAIAIDAHRSEQGKTAAIDQSVAATNHTITTARTSILTATGEILDQMRTAAYPARPGPADATQEAVLASLKTDLRMLWERYEDGDLVDAMADSLSRAIGDHDDLAVWLLASSRWPEDYLTSRGEDANCVAWGDEVAGILNRTSPAAIAATRRIYLALSDGRNGLPLANVLLNWVTSITSEIAQWRPSSIHPVPPTRL